MLALKALLVDFDGTACLQDVSEMLLDAFGEPGWRRFDETVDRGEMGLREAADHQTAMLRGSREEMLAFALGRAELAQSFAPFVSRAEERRLPLELASDGFAFYGVAYLRWESFDDVREALEEAETLPGPVGAERCPGWRTS
jgi:2-hydroxy-3-keto-5-methylthiopentenyl-1-phosphate phosphatase